MIEKDIMAKSRVLREFFTFLKEEKKYWLNTRHLRIGLAHQAPRNG